MAETTLKECCGRYLCERCGGTGRQEAGCWDGKAYAAPAGTCDSCGGEGRLGFKDQTPVFPLSPPAAAPQTVDPLAELTRAKAAFDDPTTDREESTRALAVAAILAYHDLADRFSRLSASEARHKPINAYSCQRCGRADGLDAVVPNDVWRVITEGEWANPDPATRRGEIINGRWNLLCLWCIDELCAEHGIKCSASLHFCGKAITAGSQSDADREQISRACGDREAAEARVRELEAEHRAMKERLIETEELIKDEDGTLRWPGNGEPIAARAALSVGGATGDGKGAEKE